MPDDPLLNEPLRRFFRILNRFLMVPMFRLGLAPFMGNPLSGYIMVIKTVGRKSGKTRYAPVNYVIHKGGIYCMAGFGHISDWYRNVTASPEIELILPGGAISGHVEAVEDREQKRILVRQLLKNAGFAGFFEGFNPFTVSDEELMRKVGDLPLLRINPSGIGASAADPGGLAWVWWVVAIVGLVIWIILK